MNILLIMPSQTDLIHSESLPLGIMSIAAYLRKYGYNTKICDLAVEKVSLKKICNDFHPDIVGLSFPAAKAIDGLLSVSKFFRKTDIPIVWGGPFCDVILPEHLFADDLVDVVSFSEGEATWLELVRAYENGGDLSEVKGIAYKKNGEIIITPPREFMPPAELPRLDFSMVDVKSYYHYLYGCSKLLYVYLSKGCPAHCTFCVNTVCHRNTRRRRSLDVFMDEIRELVTVYGANGFYFADELAFINDAELYEVCDGFGRIPGDFHWGFQTRVGTLSKEAIKKAYECGCRWIDFGIESGNREMLSQIKKNIPYDKIEATFEACSQAGMISIANFIIGFPGETSAQAQDSINLAKRLKSTQNTFSKYSFLPTTPLGREIRASEKKQPEYQNIRDYKKTDIFSNHYGLSEIPQKELNVIQSHFLWKAIFRKDYGGTKDYDLLFKSVKTVLLRIRRMRPSCAFSALFEISTDFIRFFIDEKLDKKIHEKYGLK